MGAPKVNLSKFNNDWYTPQRGKLWQTVWYFLGLPLLKAAWIPSYAFRTGLLRLFGAKIGANVVVKQHVRVKYPWLLEVGNNVWIGEDAWIDNLAPVTLGDNSCLSQGAYLCTGNHDWSDVRFGLIIKPIALEQSSWAGARTVLGPGVTLREGAIAAAGSVVLRDIPPWEIHAGNPAAFLRKRELREDDRTGTRS
jgi:putative colanic acid biosynthesis acetyltransferase WcaF